VSSPSLLRQGLKAGELARAIFKAELPESVVRALPAQSVYMALKINGVEASSDLIALLTPEQYRSCLDFDLWNRDIFTEDHFWKWLEASDEDNTLEPLKRFLGSIDLKLISIIIGRYIVTVVRDEPTDSPPGPMYYTPDNGYSWIHISIENSDQHRLLAKLLAYIFETSAELFYQLISIPTVSTESELVETAFQERISRVSDEGIPDTEISFKINTPLPLAELKTKLTKAKREHAIEYVPIIDPLLYESENPDLVGNLAKTLHQMGEDRECNDFEAELSLIMNAALVRFSINFWETEDVSKIAAKVKGALNIGLKLSKENSSLSEIEAFRVLGLQTIYRAGLAPILELSKIAQRLPKEVLESIEHDAPIYGIVSAVRVLFPEYPNFLNGDGSYLEAEGKLLIGQRAFVDLGETNLIKEILLSRFKN